MDGWPGNSPSQQRRSSLWIIQLLNCFTHGTASLRGWALSVASLVLHAFSIIDGACPNESVADLSFFRDRLFRGDNAPSTISTMCNRLQLTICQLGCSTGSFFCILWLVVPEPSVLIGVPQNGIGCTTCCLSPRSQCFQWRACTYGYIVSYAHHP